MPDATYTTYAEIKARLDEIAAAADDDSLPIDDALSLYEEAVKLGLAASSLIEQDIEARDAADAAVEAVEADAAGEAAPTSGEANAATASEAVSQRA